MTYRLADNVERWARERPDDPAVICRGSTLSWAQLQVRGAELAGLLEDLGVGPGDRVGHLDVNASEAADLTVATARLGATLTPQNWRMAQPELQRVMDDADVAVLVCGSRFEAEGRALADHLTDVPLVVYPDGGPPPWSGGRRSQARHEWEPGETAVQHYTSGTTGDPKGVMLSARNLQWLLGHAPEHWHVRPDSRVLIASPTFHIAGLAWLILALDVGAVSVVAPQVVPEELLDDLERERVTTVLLVPTILKLVTEVPGAAERDLSALEIVFYGASPITTSALKAAMRTFGCAFAQQYGPRRRRGRSRSSSRPSTTPRARARTCCARPDGRTRASRSRSSTRTAPCCRRARSARSACARRGS